MPPLALKFDPFGDGSQTANTREGSAPKRGIGAVTSDTLNTTVAPNGVDLMEVLRAHNDVLLNLEMRMRSVENSVYITLKTTSLSEFVIKGIAATKKHYEIVTKAKKENQPAHIKKQIGGPAIYVGFSWVKLIFEMINTIEQDKPNTVGEIVRLQCKRIVDTATNVHAMSSVFSHSQTWITKDGKSAFMKYKFHPWFRDIEDWITRQLISAPDYELIAQPAPMGPRMRAANEALGINTNTKAAENEE